MDKIRVLIVDDSATIRSALRIMIRRQKDMEVVGTAANGLEGTRLAEELKPDIVLMDIEMPVMTGIEAVREIMKKCPMPVLIFSSIAEESAPATLEALEAGAVDFVTKGGIQSSIDIGVIRDTLLTKIRGVIGSGVKTKRNPASTLVRNRESFKSHLEALKDTVAPDSPKAKKLTKQINVADIANRQAPTPPPEIDVEVPDRTTRILPQEAGQDFYQEAPIGFDENTPKLPKKIPRSAFRVVVIGASTGGPQALHSLIARIPGNFPLPIVIVQHMPQTFVPTFAHRLDRESECMVTVAVDGEEPRPGHVYIAPGGLHLRMRERMGKLRFELKDDDVENVLHKPSVDVMLQSLAPILGGDVLVSILTGMGRDGAAGAKELHELGATVIAQNEDTCVVYGMPRAVVVDGAADVELPIEEIGDALVYLAYEAQKRFPNPNGSPAADPDKERSN